MLMERRWARVCLWCLLLVIMALIFGFSSEDGETSMATSEVIARPIAETIAQRRKVPKSQFKRLLNDVQWYVRKTAHFLEYAALGVVLYLLHASYHRKQPMVWSVVLSAVYAGTDEIHQLLSGERTGMWEDVLLDTCGAFAGVMAAFLLLKLCRYIAEKRKTKTQFT